MWCEYCQSAVLGQKTTARARNTAGFLALGLTGGLSAFAFKNEGYVCPRCGQPVRRIKEESRAAPVAQEVRDRFEACLSAGPGQAFCMVPGCYRRIYCGDAECPSGHSLTPGWEASFIIASPQGDAPEAHPEGKKRARTPTAQVAATASPARSVIEELKDLDALRSSGAITQSEFDDLKAKLLG